MKRIGKHRLIHYFLSHHGKCKYFIPFFVGCQLFFSLSTGTVIVLKNGCVEHFLVIPNDRMTTNFEHCSE